METPLTVATSRHPDANGFFSRLLKRPSVVISEIRTRPPSATTSIPFSKSSQSIPSLSSSVNTVCTAFSENESELNNVSVDEVLAKVAHMLQENKMLRHRCEELTVQSQLNQDMFQICSQDLLTKDADIENLKILKMQHEQIIVELQERLRALMQMGKQQSSSLPDFNVKTVDTRLLKSHVNDFATRIRTASTGYKQEELSESYKEQQQMSINSCIGKDDAKTKNIRDACIQGPTLSETITEIASPVLQKHAASSIPSSKLKRGKDWVGMTWSFD